MPTFAVKQSQKSQMRETKNNQMVFLVIRKDNYMTIEKVAELLTQREAFNGRKQSSETHEAWLKVAGLQLADVPEDVGEYAFWEALGSNRFPSQFIPDWSDTAKKLLAQRAGISVETLWTDALDVAYTLSGQQRVNKNGGYITDAEDGGHRFVDLDETFNKQPEAVKRYFGNANRQIAALCNDTRSNLERIKRRDFLDAISKEPVKDLCTPAQLKQLALATSCNVQQLNQ